MPLSLTLTTTILALIDIYSRIDPLSVVSKVRDEYYNWCNIVD